MVIALIVNQDGFPFSYETFDGNRADVSTMESILRMVERKYGKARRIWVMDRGIVSEENLAAIRKRGGQYLVGMPRRQMKRFEAELLKADWTRVRPDVEVKRIAIPQGEETYILCRTAGRKEKETAIRNFLSYIICSMRSCSAGCRTVSTTTPHTRKSEPSGSRVLQQRSSRSYCFRGIQKTDTPTARPESSSPHP